MLRRTDVTILMQPRQSWPLWFSLLLHGTLILVCCAIPHTPKIRDCIMVDLQMPNLASLGPSGGEPAPGPKNAAPAAREAQPAAPARHETREQVLPAKSQPQAPPISVQRPSIPQPASTPAISRGTDTGVAKGQTASSQAHAQTGGGGSGPGKSHQAGNVSGAGGGTGFGGSGGGSNRPVDGVFGGQGGPAYLHKVLPVYPRFAQRIGKEGTVLLRLTLDENGNIKTVEVMEKAGHGFDESAVTAVRASRFKPAVSNGRPVPCRVLLPIRFELLD